MGLSDEREKLEQVRKLTDKAYRVALRESLPYLGHEREMILSDVRMHLLDAKLLLGKLV